ASGRRGDPAYLCGGKNLMVHTVRQLPAGAVDSCRVGGERWSAPVIAGSDASDKTPCAGILRAKAPPQPDMTDVVGARSATLDDCAGVSSQLITPARLADFYGTQRRTRDSNMGEITNATRYLDAGGEHFSFRKFACAFYPRFLWLTPVDDDDYHCCEVQCSGQFGPIAGSCAPEGQRLHCENFANLRAAVKRRMHRDLINTETWRQSRGARGTADPHPQCLRLPSVGLNRFMTRACADYPGADCSRGLPPREGLDSIGAPRDRDIWLLNKPR
ncbi:unnamed protein product, partial [Prorocentrum cordatum]